MKKILDFLRPVADNIIMKTYNEMTKDQAIEVLVDRIAKKFPLVDVAKERAVLSKRSRASLLHSVGAQWYGDTTEVDSALCTYAYGEMTPDERREIDQAG